MPKALTDADVGAFRQRLCAVAEAQFAQHGYAGVTMRELARVMDVSPMTPYRYFKDRDEILAAVRAAAFARFTDVLEAAFASGADALARSRAVGSAYLDFAMREPDAYRLIFDLTQPEEERYPELSAQSQRARGLLARQVEDLMAAKLVAGEPEVIQYALWAASHGVILLHLAGKYRSREMCIAAFRQTMQCLFAGFALSARERDIGIIAGTASAPERNPKPTQGRNR